MMFLCFSELRLGPEPGEIVLKCPFFHTPINFSPGGHVCRRHLHSAVFACKSLLGHSRVAGRHSSIHHCRYDWTRGAARRGGGQGLWSICSSMLRPCLYELLICYPGRYDFSWPLSKGKRLSDGREDFKLYHTCIKLFSIYFFKNFSLEPTKC